MGSWNHWVYTTEYLWTARVTSFLSFLIILLFSLYHIIIFYSKLKLKIILPRKTSSKYFYMLISHILTIFILIILILQCLIYFLNVSQYLGPKKNYKYVM